MHTAAYRIRLLNSTAPMVEDPLLVLMFFPPSTRSVDHTTSSSAGRVSPAVTWCTQSDRPNVSAEAHSQRSVDQSNSLDDCCFSSVSRLHLNAVKKTIAINSALSV